MGDQKSFFFTNSLPCQKSTTWEQENGYTVSWHCTNTVTLTQFLSWIQWQEQRVRNWKLVEEHVLVLGVWGRNNSPLRLILLQLSERGRDEEGTSGGEQEEDISSHPEMLDVSSSASTPLTGNCARSSSHSSSYRTLFIHPRANFVLKRDETTGRERNGAAAAGWPIFTSSRIRVRGWCSGCWFRTKMEQNFVRDLSIFMFPVMKIVINLWRVS